MALGGMLPTLRYRGAEISSRPVALERLGRRIVLVRGADGPVRAADGRRPDERGRSLAPTRPHLRGVP